MNEEIKLKRLKDDYEDLKKTCTVNPDIGFEILELKNKLDDIPFTDFNFFKNNPPTKYLIKYKGIGVSSIRNDKSPVYSNYHEIEITLTEKYPFEFPKCQMKTKIWHPNILSNPPYEGMVCVGINDSSRGLGHWVVFLTEMVSYKIFNNESPVVREAADWVKNYAIPNGIISEFEGINLDKVNFKTNDSYRKKEYKEMIANDKSEELLKLLIDNDEYSDYHNELFLHLGNLNKINKELRMGTMDNSTVLFHFRNLNLSLLKLIDEIEK